MFNDKKRETLSDRESVGIKQEGDLKEVDQKVKEHQQMEDTSSDGTQKIVTVIGEGTIVTGDIHAENDLTILGKVEGNADCKADMMVKGTIKGNITAKNLIIDQSDVEGDIHCKSNFQLTGKTELHGNIEAGNADVEGSIQGNLLIENKLVLTSEARIAGDITAGTIEVMEGAEILGNMKVGRKDRSYAAQTSSEEGRKISGGYVKKSMN